MSESVDSFNQGDLKISESVSSCNLCDKTFFDKNELDWYIRKQHLRLGWPALPLKCDLCGAAYIRKSELKDHIEEHHRSSPKPPVEEIDDKHEEEVDKASVKPRKQKKNDSIWLEKSANVKINPSMSTCQCGCRLHRM